MMRVTHLKTATTRKRKNKGITRNSTRKTHEKGIKTSRREQ
jgi:hypothetical protein